MDRETWMHLFAWAHSLHDDECEAAIATVMAYAKNEPEDFASDIASYRTWPEILARAS